MIHLPGIRLSLFALLPMLSAGCYFNGSVEKVSAGAAEKGCYYEYRVTGIKSLWVFITSGRRQEGGFPSLTQQQLSKLELSLRSNKGLVRCDDILIKEGGTKRIPLYLDTAYGEKVKQGAYAHSIIVYTLVERGMKDASSDFTVIVRDPGGVTRESGLRISTTGLD